MRRLLAFLSILILIAVPGCVPEENLGPVSGTTETGSESGVTGTVLSPAEIKLVSNVPDDGVLATIFLTGNTRGQLKPCGCAEGQLGGFSPREGIFNRVDPEKRILIDTGNLVESDSEQDMLKLDAIFQSLQYLRYDVVNFNDDDIAAASDRYSLDQVPFEFISPSTEKMSFSKQIETAGGILQVNVVSLKSESVGSGVLDSYFRRDDKLILNVLLLDRCPEDVRNYLTQSSLVDVVICPSEADKPVVLEENIQKPLFVSVGNLGKYTGKLEVKAGENRDFELVYSAVAVDEELPGSEALDGIYYSYKEMVKLHDILAKVTRVSLPGDLKYAGSDKCKVCHRQEYDKWSKSGHAHAYQTLVDVGSQYDPECINCHVVGLKYESGFENEKSPKGLRNVGCEVCHGPRSEHIENALKSKTIKSKPQPAFDCASCHTPDHSPGYQADPEGYHKKINHW